MKQIISNFYDRLCLLSFLLMFGILSLLGPNSSMAQKVLPEPPKLGNQTFDASNPIDYIVGGIRYVIFLGLTIVVVLAILAFSGGLISEVNQARRNGEWGRFTVFFGAGLLVIVVVIFGAWWGSTRLSEIIDT